MYICYVTAHEASMVLQKRGILQSMGIEFEDLVSDTQDNYRLFVNLEKLLKNPPMLANQQMYQLDPETQKVLIDRYLY